MEAGRVIAEHGRRFLEVLWPPLYGIGDGGAPALNASQPLALRLCPIRSPPSHFRPMHTFLSHGVRIAYYHYAPVGSDRGEPIVLVHGFASSCRINWVNPRWVDTLTKAGRRVIALDNRGHGASAKLYDPEAYTTDLMAGDVAGLIDHLDLTRVDLMGYSMGARIASAVASRHPEPRAVAHPRRSRDPSRRGRRTAGRHRRGDGGALARGPQRSRRSACSALSPTSRRATEGLWRRAFAARGRRSAPTKSAR